MKEYKERRRFDRTAEPEGRVKTSDSGRMFVVQKHAAGRLHYDFRLEMDGVLKSWAVPKGPSTNPSDKRLAVHVEDHPLEYGNFEGIIPEDEYGGGTVMLWDRGEWEPEEDPRKGYRKGRLKFRLKGQRLQGLWILAKMAEKADGTEKNWLLIKADDKHAGTEGEILQKHSTSVVSGRTMEEIAGDRDRVWSSGSAPIEDKQYLFSESREETKNHIPEDLSLVSGVRRADFPAALRPQLPTLVEETPAGDDWLHEIKYDGYRILGFKKNSQVRLITRNGKNWTDRFSSIEKGLSQLSAETVVTDGEIVVKSADGTTDFQALQNVLKGIDSGRLAYYAFDLLYLNGFDLMRSSLLERKNLLRSLLINASAESLLLFSDHIRGRGQIVYRNACRYALEGVVSKRSDAEYRQKRSREWVKTKCLNRQEFVVAGFTEPSGSRTGFGALLLGYYTSAGKLLYAGKVGTGFNETMLEKMTGDLIAIERSSPSFSDPPTGAEAKKVHWVEPETVVEIEFAAWTKDGKLRQAAFKGIREDKKAGEVVREKAPDENSKTQRSSSLMEKKSRTKKNPARVAGIRLSNPDRVLYPDQGVTKAELAAFYEKVSEWMLPHVAGRPLTIVRCPRGRKEKCFFQKHLSEQLPEPVKGIPIKEKKGEQIYIMVDDLAGIVSLVQLGALEFHTWAGRADRLDRPDQMIFDMDPGPGISQGDLVEACRLLKSLLDDIGLKNYIKTSGGKGFHVVVPLVRRKNWDQVKAFSKAVAEKLAREHPKRFVAVMSKAKRKNRIFVDYLRNGRGAINAAPFSTRARPGAPVSTPIGWDELNEDLKPDSYTVENLPRRLELMKQDPWSDYFDVRQSITQAMERRV